MTNGRFYFTLGAGLLVVTILSISNSHQQTTPRAAADRSALNQISIVDKKLNQPTRNAQVTPLMPVETQQGMDSFELIEKKFAQLNPNQARQEVRRIDAEAQKVSAKNFDDFSTEERVAFLTRQREKVVLLNKIILARLERVQK